MCAIMQDIICFQFVHDQDVFINAVGGVKADV